jgi:hypothetical protein
VAGILLAVVGACEARSLRTADFSRRARLFVAALDGREPPRSATNGFAFDPAYGDFLLAVARRTPRDATIAVLVPPRPDVYRYQAVYLLAPRRVVDEAGTGDAGWVASWKAATGATARGERIGQGLLQAR